MKTFYTLIKISPNPSSGDLITIGLLLVTEDKVYLKFSDNKIKIAQRFLGLDENLIIFLKKQLENKAHSINEDLKNNSTELFDLSSCLTSDYISHLNNISNNLIQFSKPSYIAADFDEDKFQRFYQKMVDKTEAESIEYTEKINIYQVAREKLINKIAGKIHTDIDINNKILPSLHFSFNLDCLGKNGSIIAAKFLNFDASTQTIEKNLIRYDVVLTKLNEKYGTNHYEGFIIADEPKQKDSESYNIWETYTQNNKFTFVASQQAESVAEILEDKKAVKFLEVD